MKFGDSSTGEGGVGAEDVQRLEDKVVGLPPYKDLSDFHFFYVFFNDFVFPEFCNICYFKFLNSVLTKNIEINSSFL
jgi:hypothetical protein